MRPFLRRARSVAVLIAVASALVAESASAATITVNGTADTAANDGTCTLREAITAANNNAVSGAMAGECAAGAANPTRDAIVFAIGGSGSLQTIAPATSLPNLTSPIEIDGRNGHASLPRIEIDASTLAGSAAGLIASVSSENSYLHYFAVTNAPDDGIRLLVGDITLERLAIGVSLADAAAGNGDQGVSVIGAGTTIRDSVISDSGAAGVRLEPTTPPATDITITGNRIGTNLAGTADFGNAGDGISAQGATGTMPDNLVVGGMTDPTPGGACDGDCNLISGNGGDGVDLSTFTAPTPLTGLSIRGNYVGTDAAGTGDLGNASSGIRLAGPMTAPVLRANVVAGNGGDGISLVPGTNGGPTGAVIAANRIGADREGDDALANSGRGIYLAVTLLNTGDVADTVIGGTVDPTPGGACDGDCNVIAGNGLDGIGLTRTAGGQLAGTLVLGNHIGIDADGTSGLDNNQWGIALLGAADTSIGSPAAPNVISGNGASGILVQQNDPGGNVIQSNLIGTTADGIGEVANGESGIDVFAGGSGVVVGGTAPGEGNTIARNTEAGVSVAGLGTPTAAVPIIGNSIFSNPGLGIDLMPDGITAGVTANDGPGDPDDGGNGLQNFPVLDTVAVAGSSTFVLGSLDTAASTRYRIEVYANDVADPSGHGEGHDPAGAFEVTTDANGHAGFSAELTGTTAAGKSVSATATELDGSGEPLRTSEFGANVAEGCNVTGTAAADTLTGGAAPEVICGLGGDDIIAGAGGDDVIIGGDGVDTVSYASAEGAANVQLDAGTGSAAGAGDDLLREIENATGSAFADTLDGSSADNVLEGGSGDDLIAASGGNDSLLGDQGDDQLLGGDGDDTLRSHGGRDGLEGGSGADTVKAGGGDKDDARGQGGDDSVKGGGGKKDDVRGGGGKDKLDGGGGKKDDCDGGSGKDHKPAPGCESEKSIP